MKRVRIGRPPPGASDPGHADRDGRLEALAWCAAATGLAATAWSDWLLALAITALGATSESAQLAGLARLRCPMRPSMLLPSRGTRLMLAAAADRPAIDDRLALAGVAGTALGCAAAALLLGVDERFAPLPFAAALIGAVKVAPMVPTDYDRSERWGALALLIPICSLAIVALLVGGGGVAAVVAALCAVEVLERRRSFDDPVERRYMLAHRRPRLAVATCCLAVAVVLLP